MGMGEPLLNLDNVLAACERLPDLGITARRTAISTVGWIPGIERLSDEGPPVRLALSLHAADEALRSELIPVNDRYPLADVLDACRAHHARRKRMIFVEYVMLAGINDRYEQALALADALDPRVFKVNLIPYNPTDSPYQGSGREAISAFRAALEKRGLLVTVRLTRGRDIAAACGQLAASGSSTRSETRLSGRGAGIRLGFARPTVEARRRCCAAARRRRDRAGWDGVASRRGGRWFLRATRRA